VLVALLAMSLIVAAMLQGALLEQRRVGNAEERQQARWLSVSALQRARYALTKSPDYAGELWRIPADTTSSGRTFEVMIRVEPTDKPSDERRVRVETRDPQRVPTTLDIQESTIPQRLHP
jgi:type II secretory pathway component PulK